MGNTNQESHIGGIIMAQGRQDKIVTGKSKIVKWGKDRELVFTPSLIFFFLETQIGRKHIYVTV